ncbi:MAG: hypothetical protein LRS43_02985 [Desulfurococcales archaeon]|nr:hypothetical protein [Desulfurococcales archaeon]
MEERCDEDIRDLIDQIFVRIELLEARLSTMLSSANVRGVIGVVSIINELQDRLSELRRLLGSCTCSCRQL